MNKPQIITHTNLTEFQLEELNKLFDKDINVIDYSFDDNDLILKVKDNEIVVEHYIICNEDDVFFSAIGKQEDSENKLFKIN